MIQNMIRADPNVSPMVGAYLEQMANNPSMMEEVTRRMQDPTVRAQLQQAMRGVGGGGAGGMMPGMMGGGVMGPDGTTINRGNVANSSPYSTQPRPNPPPPPHQQQQGGGSDEDLTEDEMIAEAIRRSLEES
jgi:hypothetical protein